MTFLEIRGSTGLECLLDQMIWMVLRSRLLNMRSSTLWSIARVEREGSGRLEGSRRPRVPWIWMLEKLRSRCMAMFRVQRIKEVGIGHPFSHNSESQAQANSKRPKHQEATSKLKTISNQPQGAMSFEIQTLQKTTYLSAY